MASRDTEDDEVETEKQRKVRERYAIENRVMLGDMLATYVGRQYLWRLLTRCGIFRMSFKPGEADTTSFNEGQRNVGLGIFRDIMEVDQKLFAQMQAEGEKRERDYQEDMRKGTE